MTIEWLFVSVVCSVFLLARLYRGRALSHVNYTRHFSSNTAYEGETVEMIERVANRKLLPLPWLRLESMISRGLVFGRQEQLDISTGSLLQNHMSVFSLAPYRQVVRRHRVTCAKRGRYRLDTATMTAGDPFGIMQVSQGYALSLELTVYPAFVPLGDIPLPNHGWMGDFSVRRWMMEDPFLAAGVREYRPGDALNTVSWKATARTGQLQVHKREYTADHRLMICLNVENTETAWKSVSEPERIEAGLRYAASIAEHATRQGVETGFLCNARAAADRPGEPVRFQPAGGAAHLHELLYAMALLEMEIAASFPAMLEEERQRGTANTDYLLITCHTGGTMMEQIDALKRAGNGVEVLLIPKEAAVDEEVVRGAENAS